MNTENYIDELVDLLAEKSFSYSDEPCFRLASGQMSRYYVNCKPVTLFPRGMYLIGHLVFERIREFSPAGAGGLTFGADPIAMAVAYTSELAKNPVKAFSIRKTRKDHGTGKWIEGDIHPGERVVIVEDVVTTGGSTLNAIERAREEGLDPVAAAVLVDRQEGGMDKIVKHVPHAFALVTRDALQKCFLEKKR